MVIRSHHREENVKRSRRVSSSVLVSVCGVRRYRGYATSPSGLSGAQVDRRDEDWAYLVDNENYRRSVFGHRCRG